MEIRLPMTAGRKLDGIITRWHCQEGGQTQKGTVLLEYETSKMAASLLAPADGILHKIVQEGTSVSYNGLVGIIKENV